MGIEELSHSDKMPMPITAKALPHIRLGMRLLVKRGSDGYPGSRPGAKTVADVAAAPGRNQVPRGIAYMLGSTVMFAGEGRRPAHVNRVLPINFCGGPDEIVAQLKQCREQIGAGVVDLSFQTPGSEHPDQLMEALELFGKNVLPHIRDI